MATGTVSSVNYDNWQLIETKTPTSGTSTTFSSLSGYKKYMLKFNGLNSTNNPCSFYMRFNGSSSAYSAYIRAGYNSWIGSQGEIYFTYQDNSIYGYAIIENPNIGAPKIIKGVAGGNGTFAGQEISGSWLSTDTITSIAIILSTGTFSSGNVMLYGLAE